MTEVPADIWAHWLLHRRHGGDTSRLQKALAHLCSIRDLSGTICTSNDQRQKRRPSRRPIESCSTKSLGSKPGMAGSRSTAVHPNARRDEPHAEIQQPQAGESTQTAVRRTCGHRVLTDGI